MKRLLVSLVLVSVLAAAAHGQKPGQRRPEPAPVRAPAVEIAAEDSVDRGRTLPYLAHTLGELHYLAYACVGEQDQQWRNRMVELLAMEAPDNGGLRNRMVESFNAGYRAQQRYRTRCGAEAEGERRALALRGRDLSEMMRAAYFD